MKLEKGKDYFIKYVENFVTRRRQSGFIVECEKRDRAANYEYIGLVGNKHHFYNQNAGYDIYLSNKEFSKIYKQP